MCNIMVLAPGVMIPKDRLYNCVWNNPDGYGLVLKNPEAKRVEVIRKLSEDKENDPKEIYDLLEDNKELWRYLHVRYKTEGGINKENLHPFDSYVSDKRRVLFMHNGTLSDWKSRDRIVTENGIRTELYPEEKEKSDSYLFNERFLRPLLLRMQGEHGHGDITDIVTQTVIEKFWNSTMSKGILISSDQDHYLINKKEWKELDFGEGKFLSSNNDYFLTLKRGQEYDRRQEKQRKKEEAERARKSRFHSANSNITPLIEVSLKKKQTLLTEELSDIFEDQNIYTRDGLASLHNLTNIEVDDIVKKNPEMATLLLIYTLDFFNNLNNRYNRAIEYLKEGKNDSNPNDIIKEADTPYAPSSQQKAA